MLETHATKDIAVGKSNNAGGSPPAAGSQREFGGRSPDAAAILQLF